MDIVEQSRKIGGKDADDLAVMQFLIQTTAASQLTRIRKVMEELLATVRGSTAVVPMPSAPASLTTFYEDSGRASSGTSSSLKDINKSWQQNKWRNHTLFILRGGVLHVTTISTNDYQMLNFIALPSGIVVDSETSYAIQAPINPTLTRWGIEREPTWAFAAPIAAPPAATALITQQVASGVLGYIFGFFISGDEPNEFDLNWTSGGTLYSKRLVFGGTGSMQAVEPLAMNPTLLADPLSNMTITVVRAAAAGHIYQANLLYA